MIRLPARRTLALGMFAGLLAASGAAHAQDGGLFDRVFGSRAARNGPEIVTAQVSSSELLVRLDRLESQIRQLTGTIEQLQFRNQQLEQQMRRMQEDVEFRFQETGRPGRPPQARPPAAQPVPAQPAPASGPPRRSDVFDPSDNPAAPGAPRTLGTVASVPPSSGGQDDDDDDDQPVGVPGGRAAGAPLDLSTLAERAANDRSLAPMPSSGESGGLPPPPPRTLSGTGAQQATLAPSATPKDEYDLAYGYLLRKDYALAEESFRGFVRKYPNDRMISDANYWLGESLYQRQRYRDAAEFFLNVSTKYDKSGKAADALLRLGQSLAALNEKDAACATLVEVGRKYPKASASVKQGVDREQKRMRCTAQ